MSADNWGFCPKCSKIAEDTSRLYGKVSEDEYLKLLSRKNNPSETLREDYQIQTDSDGIFFITYSCHCSECGFSFKFKHTEDVLENDEI